MSRIVRALLTITILIAAPSASFAQGPAAQILADPPALFLSESKSSTLLLWVMDAAGNGVADPAVTLTGPPSGPRAFVQPMGTGMEFMGIVAFTLSAEGGLGTYQLTAAAGAASVTIDVTNGPDPVRIVSGDQMSTLAGTIFPEPIVFEVMSPDGSPYAGATVTFEPQPRATLSSGPYVTGPDGKVTITATAGSGVGDFNLRATVTTSFTTQEMLVRLASLSSHPASLSSLGDVQLQVGGDPGGIGVEVRTPTGQVARGVAVTFEFPTAGAGIDQVYEGSDGPPFRRGNTARILTDFDGWATIWASANALQGSYTVTARVDGGAAPAQIAVRNVVPTVAEIRPNGYPWDDYRGESAVVNGRFDALRFKAVDTNGNGMPGVTIKLTPMSVYPASVTLDQTEIVTDAEGFAETGGTANSVTGYYYVKAEVDGLDLPAYMYMQNRLPGFTVGEQIANFTALDQDGNERSMSSLLTGSNFLLLDVCATWCVVCQNVQGANVAIQAQLAAMGVNVSIVPLLSQSEVPNEASTQANAAQWRQQFGLTEPVLHAGGQLSSTLYQAADSILGADRPGFPTFLLVAPDGTIVDRRFSAWVSVSDGVNFVLPHAPATVAIAGAAINEGAGSVTVSVSRSRATGSASVSYTTIAGSASSADFSARSGVLTFAAGEATASITVPITNDTIDEPTEQFTIRLSNPDRLRITQGDAIVTIADNDAAPAISMHEARFVEGTGTPTNAALAVTLDRASAFTVLVKYSLVAGTAKSTDVQLTTDTLTFAPGVTTRSVPLAIVPDKLVEPKETFTVTLGSASNATIAVASALVSIVDDDADTAPPMIEVKGNVVVEVKMDPKASVVVDYDLPTATDKRDGPVPVTCVAPSGSKLPFGTTKVSCTAEDRAGNLTGAAFTITVRLPTTPGAIFDPRDQATPLTDARRGERVLVHVNAGAFGARDKVALTFIDAAGRRHKLGYGRAGRDGSLDEMVDIPRDAAKGLGQVAADSGDGTEYDRAWFLTVKPARKHRHR